MKGRTLFRSMRKLFFSILLLVVILFQMGTPWGMGVVQAEDGVDGILKPTGKLSFRLDTLAHSTSLQTQGLRAQSQAIALPEQGPGSLMRNAQGKILVDIRMSDLSDSQLQEIQKAGAEIVHVANDYSIVSAYVSLGDLERMAALSTVENITEELAPIIHVSQSTLPQAAPAIARTEDACARQGSAVSEGDAQLQADIARATYSLDGSGVTVGVLSDSYNYDSEAQTGVASGDLPGAGNPCGDMTPVNVLSDINSTDTGTDEGRAMLEIVHDMAPGAKLSFATAYNGLYSFADNIRGLQTAGANIIVDDVTYFAEPFFQDGPVSVAISDVVAKGAVYFTSAGNGNLILNGNTISSYEAPSFRSTTCPTFTYNGSSYSMKGKCHDFDPTGGTSNSSWITLAPYGYVLIDLQWSEPWHGVADDLDMYLLDENNTLVSFSTDTNTGGSGTQMPVEVLGYQNWSSSAHTFRIIVNRYEGSGTPRLKYMFMQNGDSESITAVQYPTSTNGDIVGPSLMGHSASNSSLSVAAVPYNDRGKAEYYSSNGPAYHYYGPVKSDSNPAAAIAAEKLQQPDFAATDGGCTTFFGYYENGCERFYGTSASAPHAAGIAALLKQKANSAHWTFDRSVAKNVLQASSRSVFCTNDANRVGSGLLNAAEAVRTLAKLNGTTLSLAGLVDFTPQAALSGPNFIFLPAITSCR